MTTTTGLANAFQINSNVTSVNNKVFRINSSGATFADQPYSSAGRTMRSTSTPSPRIWPRRRGVRRYQPPNAVRAVNIPPTGT